jgi:hypothetical protein
VALQSAVGNLGPLQDTFVRSFRAALVACACLAFVGVFASLVRGSHELRKVDSPPRSR